MRLRRRNLAVPIRHSIGTQIFLAFAILMVIAGGLGSYGLFSLWKLGAIVADTYDRPLMAINFARSASFIFAEMQNEALRLRLDPATDKSVVERRLKELSGDFFDDLSVAEQRSLADRERDAARDIRHMVQRWVTLPSTSDSRDADELRDLSTQIAERFDTMIELTADDSFLERRQSVVTVQWFEYLSVGATITALIAAVAIALYLTRQISKPLGAAAEIAERIGHGEMQTPFPAPSLDETGVLLKSLKVMQDRIRGMIEREQAQRQSAQARLIDAVESSREAMALINPDGRIALSNTQFGRVYPSIKAHLANQTTDAESDADVLTVSDSSMTPLHPIILADDADILLDGGEFAIGDNQWIKVSRSPTREGGFFLFFSDISDMKEREERYREAKLTAEAASTAKSHFLANMSHELRTPLNAIIGFSDLFAGEYLGPIGAGYKEHAQEIQASGWRLLAIIENVLDLSNSQSGNLALKVEPHDLRETVEECRRPLQKICGEAGLTLTVDYGEIPLMMSGDSEKLRRIIDNLTSNAVKFNKAGGGVTLIARAVEATIELEVTDTGIGIPENDISLALSAFGQIESTLNRHYEGTGLGLALATAYTEAHGGKMRLSSKLGEGTTVIVSFDRLAGARTKGTPQSAGHESRVADAAINFS